jgi:hypothetical protein
MDKPKDDQNEIKDEKTPDWKDPKKIQELLRKSNQFKFKNPKNNFRPNKPINRRIP